MEIDLAGRDLPVEPWPEDYRLLPWDESLLEAFAQAKYKSFRDEIDANVFPCLGDWAGCRRLMVEISRKPGFLPGATWLLAHQPPGQRRSDYCGTVQGVRDREGWGAIQNLGVTTEHRNRGLGLRLMHMALRGFRDAGLTRAHLEVTAHNDGAIRLYRRMGFVIVKTIFKISEVTCAP